ncbi:hypothetical protein EYF80_054394 [Liparis tanakae]|uniref:Uncharacterized protein n=1 Tax=Liparis tanakae TaxID=230148 RepID=A0A4Z2F2T2_9TELE|nr:hypothetical protein EYF80_054394 [Liparis tanakae]
MRHKVHVTRSSTSLRAARPPLEEPLGPKANAPGHAHREHAGGVSQERPGGGARAGGGASLDQKTDRTPSVRILYGRAECRKRGRRRDLEQGTSDPSCSDMHSFAAAV